ncbi:MAG: ABC transporter ATP-binding protein [Candidatus Omnitrophica bacterium]|nr:ABC transporter ATP-binding protein [Candidatus Omnitrophota bacterium]
MIEIKNVSMHYGPLVALAEVSFSVQKGEILGLLGPNGAGKSTLMKILTTFLVPSKGTASIAGNDILEKPLSVRECVGYLPETVPLYPEMRVDEYVAFVGNARGIAGEKLRQRLAWVQESCGLVSVWKHTMCELSKGYRQRVGLAQALVHDPQILILDEPTSGLDPVQIIGIRKLIRQLSKDKTIIFSTHILQEVDVLADRIVIINEGKIISQGTRAQLLEQAMRQRCYRLTVREDAATAEKALGGIAEAKNISCIERHADGLVTFAIKGAFNDDAALWQKIDALNREKRWPVKEFTEQTYNLEEMFIALLSKSEKAVRNSGEVRV